MATCKDCLHFNDCLSYGKTRYYYRMKNKEASLTNMARPFSLKGKSQNKHFRIAE